METLSIEQIAKKIYDAQVEVVNCNLNIIGITLSTYGNPTIHLTEESFRNSFKYFKVLSRDSQEFPFELTTDVGHIKFFTLSSIGE